MRGLIAFLVGVLFALGLGMSGMTQPRIVRGFLDVLGQWDWRLMGVMIGAIGVHAIAFPLIMKKKSPLLDTEFKVPDKKHIDSRLVLGAIIFGLGWGWAGICPGPGIVALASGKMEFIYFIGSMLIGMKLYQLIDKKA
jgi:uncharacterized membrane protein YedE/YeeE